MLLGKIQFYQPALHLLEHTCILLGFIKFFQFLLVMLAYHHLSILGLALSSYSILFSSSACILHCMPSSLS